MALQIELPSTQKEKLQASSQVLEAIDKKYGEGSVFSMGSRVGLKMPHLSTGIFELDHDVIGIGGIPRGRVTELYGPESSGKTTLALKLIASSQKEGNLCAIIDVENALSPDWCNVNGVDVKALTVSQPDCGEDALGIAEQLIDSGAYSVVVIDSVAALVTRSELDGDIGDAVVGAQARLMSQSLRMLSGKVRRTGTVLLFVNQLRDRIGITWGSPETTSGGKSLKFYASLRFDIRKIQVIKDGETPIGNMVKIKCVKNKVGIPYKTMEIDLLFDRGFNAEGNLLDYAIKLGIASKSGAWYNYGSERLGQGRTKAVEAMIQMDKVEEIRKSLIEKLKSGV